MIWTCWRQQRTETLIAAAILALLAAVLVPTGIQMAHAYQHDGLAACLGIPAGDLAALFARPLRRRALLAPLAPTLEAAE